MCFRGGVKRLKFDKFPYQVLKTLFQDLCSTGNKTGLQPVSRLVELVLYFGGWVEGPKQTDRTDGGG